MTETTRIPSPRVPFLDNTGLISREWYRFLNTLFVLTGNGSTAITPAELQAEIDVLDGQVATLTVDVADANTAIDTINTDLTVFAADVAAASLEAASVAQTPVSDVSYGETQALLQAVEQNPPALIDQIAVLSNQLDGLSLTPVYPDGQTLYYGVFHDTTTQTAAAANTAYAITYNTVDYAYGVSRESSSQIHTNNPGIFNFQFSLQMTKTGGSVLKYAYVWARVSGVDVPYSATRIAFQGNNSDIVASWNFVLQMGALDYFELMWSVEDTTIEIPAYATISPAPAIPSVILTVTQCNLPYGH